MFDFYAFVEQYFKLGFVALVLVVAIAIHLWFELRRNRREESAAGNALKLATRYLKESYARYNSLPTLADIDQFVDEKYNELYDRIDNDLPYQRPFDDFLMAVQWRNSLYKTRSAFPPAPPIIRHEAIEGLPSPDLGEGSGVRVDANTILQTI